MSSEMTRIYSRKTCEHLKSLKIVAMAINIGSIHFKVNAALYMRYRYFDKAFSHLIKIVLLHIFTLSAWLITTEKVGPQFHHLQNVTEREDDTSFS